MSSSHRPQLPYTQIFAAYAAVIVAVSAGIMFLLTRTVRERVLQQAQHEAPFIARALALEFARSVSLRGLNPENPRQTHAHLDRLFRQRAQPQGVAWLKVYAADGRILYSPDPDQVGQWPEDVASIQAVLQGRPKVMLLRAEDEPDLAGRGLPEWLVEVYAPLPPESAPFRIFEIYLDATPYLERGRLLQWRIGGILTLGATALFGLLVYITRRAYGIIELQMQELAEAHAALQRLEAHKRGLVNMVVHDLRNLLGVMTGHAELLALDAEGERARWANSMLQAGQQMQQMMQNMLDLARLEDATFPLQWQAVEPARIVHEAAAPFCRWAQEQGKDCQVQVADPIPSVWADPTALARVLQNLVGNAVHHARHAVDIQVQPAPEGGVFFIIRDDGEGIPPEHLPHIFEPYYRVPGTQRRGSGLGLAFCQQAIQALNGRLEVESTPGQGSLFRIWLPEAPA